MKGSENENASMGYFKFRKNKRTEKNSDTCWKELNPFKKSWVIYSS